MTGDLTLYAKWQAHDPSVDCRAHVQRLGWLDTVRDGVVAGTTGQSRRLEAIQLSISNLPYRGSIEYRAHVQTTGWQSDWERDGQTSGTTGKSKRLEAVQIRLTDELSNQYDVWYRVHVQRIGWMGWAKNGQTAGTTGESRRAEAIQVVLVPKGQSEPPATYMGESCAFAQPSRHDPSVDCRAHVQRLGWLDTVRDGVVAGTTGQSRRLEAIQLSISNLPYRGSIEYRAHVQTTGWQSDWERDGQTSGTTGKSKRLEAVQIRLTDELSNQYDVWYRVHVQRIGWMGWAKNGQTAGTTGESRRAEAIQVVLVPKGQSEPPATYMGESCAFAQPSREA